jgi:hypothetical protein
VEGRGTPFGLVWSILSGIFAVLYVRAEGITRRFGLEAVLAQEGLHHSRHKGIQDLGRVV